MVRILRSRARSCERLARRDKLREICYIVDVPCPNSSIVLKGQLAQLRPGTTSIWIPMLLMLRLVASTTGCTSILERFTSKVELSTDILHSLRLRQAAHVRLNHCCLLMLLLLLLAKHTVVTSAIRRLLRA